MYQARNVPEMYDNLDLKKTAELCFIYFCFIKIMIVEYQWAVSRIHNNTKVY